MYLLLKSLLSGAIIAAVSEIARRSTLFGALVASLPLTSVLAMIWLYHESHDTSRVAALSGEIFWLVLPSLVLFLVLCPGSSDGDCPSTSPLRSRADARRLVMG